MKDPHDLTSTSYKADPQTRALVLQAQAGSQEAFDCLLTRYRPLLEASVARFESAGLSEQEREDLREEAERIFLTAITTFDTEQEGVELGLYARICIRNGLVSAWRHICALRRTTALPLQEQELVEPDPASILEEEERFHQLCRIVRGLLSDFENSVWWQYVTGVPVADIARELGRDERSVHNAIYRIRTKLRKRLTPPTD